MTPRFLADAAGVTAKLGPGDREFLRGVVSLLEMASTDEGDPGHRRLNVPAYLDEPGSTTDGSRRIADELEVSRSRDRDTYLRCLETGNEFWTLDEAEAFLRVLNEGRLVFGARIGIEVAADYERLDTGQEAILGWLGWLLEELTDQLSERL